MVRTERFYSWRLHDLCSLSIVTCSLMLSSVQNVRLLLELQSFRSQNVRNSPIVSAQWVLLLRYCGARCSVFCVKRSKENMTDNKTRHFVMHLTHKNRRQQSDNESNRNVNNDETVKYMNESGKNRLYQMADRMREEINWIDGGIVWLSTCFCFMRSTISTCESIDRPLDRYKSRFTI